MKKSFILFFILLWTLLVNSQTVKNYDRGHIYPYQDIIKDIDTFQFQNSNALDNSFSLRIKLDTILSAKKPLSEVVINCVRADFKIPVTEKTISDSTIQDGYQGQEIPMLLGGLTSVNTNSDGGAYSGYSYFTIRGIDQTRINITLNGVPINEPEDMGVYTSNYPSFTTAIQSIQIQRGVGTSSNGASSFGGSLNFQSKDGLSKGTDIQIGSGSFGTSRFDVSNSTGLNHGFALYTNIGGIYTNGFRENSGSKGGSVFFSLGYFGKNSITKLNVLSGISRNKQAWQGGSDSILSQDYRYNPRGGDRMDYFSQSNVQLQNITKSKNLKFSNTLFYNYLDGDYDVNNIKDIVLNQYFGHENQYSRWVGAISQVDYNKNDFKVTASLSANRYNRFHNGYEIFDTTLTQYPYKNSGKKDELSGFLKFSYDTRKVVYYLDLQERFVNFKYYGDTTFTLDYKFFNPKFGIKYFINSKLSTYYSFGVSHREPTRSILLNGYFYIDSTNPINLVKPEEVFDNEIGVNYNNGKLKFQADVYVMSFRNEMITAGPLGINSLPLLINVPRSVRYGFEFDGKYKFNKHFTYEGNTTISRGEFKVDSGTYHYLFNPNFMLKHSLAYSMGKGSISINQTYISRSFIDKQNDFYLPIYSTIGVNFGYTFGKVEVTLQGNNLTGAKTYSNGYAVSGVRYRMSNALQNYFFTIRIHL